MIFGAAYESAAVVPDGTPPPSVANPVTDYVPSARPGGRAPHVWLRNDGERSVSTIDLVGNGFVLLDRRQGRGLGRRGAQRSSIEPVARRQRRLRRRRPQWRDDLRHRRAGAVLVRPDGYVGWRSPAMTADPAASLGEAMTSIMGRA